MRLNDNVPPRSCHAMLTFVVVGITDAPNPHFAPEVAELIGSAQVFSGGRRHHELVAHLLPPGAQWIDIVVPLQGVWECYRAVGNGTIVVFASGDPLFYGFAVTLRREFPDAAMRVVPAPNSLQMLAHRLCLPYHDMRVVSLTGRPWHELDRALIERAPMIGILTDRDHTPAAIVGRMRDYGYTDYSVFVGERLGNPELERVRPYADGMEVAMPNCVMAIREQRGSEGATTAPQCRRYGLPEGEFALLDGREKMITKMPIRLLTLQALDLPRRRVLWDIGACTGSVSIEARLLFPHLRVEAFEVRPECEDIIGRNARRFGTPGINVHIGDFCTLCEDAATMSKVAAPDAVFIGGHGGQLAAIMSKVVNRLPAGGVVVMNSVTSAVVDSLTPHRAPSRQMWDEACRALGLRQEPPMRIQLNDNNPIEILKAVMAG